MHRRHSAGTTVVELLVSLLVFSLFAVGIQQFSRTMSRGVAVLAAAAEAEEAARLGAQLIATDLRDAGFSPTGALDNGLRQAAVDAVAIARDLNGDGDSDDPGEAVGYAYAADRRALLRRQGAAPPQPLLDDLAADGLRLQYVAADGSRLDASGGLDDAQRRRVRRVDVSVTVEVPHPDPAYRQPLRGAHRATVALRNAVQ
jgi:type II secretory pathway component PulJ